MLRAADIDKLPAGLLVPHYLLASYCYYHLSQSPMTDDAFDRLCGRLLESYDTVRHPHKRLVDTGSLEAGTCLLGMQEYPLIVQNSAEMYLASCEDLSILEQIRNRTGPPPRPRRRLRPVPAEPVVVKPTVRRVRRVRR